MPQVEALRGVKSGVEERLKNHWRMLTLVRERANVPPPCWLKAGPKVSGGPSTAHPAFSPVVLTQEVAREAWIVNRYILYNSG